MAETNIKYTEESGIGIMTISRPEARNALNDLVLRDINLLLDRIKYSKTIRVLVITGEGKAFVAGADIAKMKELEPEEAYIWSKTGQETFKRIINLDIPVIAAINGYALGGGLELALSCDIRIASSEAKFGSPEVGLGIIPGYGGTKMLAGLIGMGDAMNIILSGQMIDAAEAMRLKLVQKVVEPEKLLETACQLALMISEKSSFAVSSAKRAIWEGVCMEMDEAKEAEAKRFSETFSHEAREGMSAFIEKRKPAWKTEDLNPLRRPKL